MEAGNRNRLMAAVFVLVIFVTVLSCFAVGRSGKEMPEEEAAVPEAEAAVEKEASDSADTWKGSRGTGEKDFSEEGDASEAEDAEGDFGKGGETVFGRGIESEETLTEDVVSALKNGDTESLVGVAFGEKFDYDLYDDWGADGCCRKEPVYDWYIRYLFDGAGHRFSGFSIGPSGESLLELNLEKCPATVFVKAFGKPDREEIDYTWEEGIVSADWYFEKAVLTVEEYKGYVRRIDYKALGDMADGDGAETKSDYELRMETKTEAEKAEAIYGFWYSGQEDVFYASEDGRDDARSADEFVENYLREQGFGYRTPDSVIYNEMGEKFAEGYIEEGKSRFAFVIYEDGSVCCAVRNLREAEEPEYLVYRCDRKGDVVQETLYDKWGMRMAEASYKYYDGVPFPFITKSWNLRYEGGTDFCRNQKTWFYEDSAESDKKGRVRAADETDDWNIKDYLEFPCLFSYRPDGKLEKIREEIPPEKFEEELLDIRENYFGEIELAYDDGVLKKIEYHHSPYFYGTGDQSGTIDFDEQGRMVHNHYYITSGCHDGFYFYHGDEKRPWAVLDWCYGIWSTRVYLPVEER